MILAGLSGVIAIEVYAAIMQREFQDTDNKIGKGFTILGIYLFAVIYCQYRPPNQMRVRVLTCFRWNAQQHNLALRRGSPTYCASQ